ncbi:phosphoesterase [Desulfurobacterium atlanticum]|uniref:Polymerase/histidinol phosphatase N-terminal domain-containing protein n=1 Tax=Desulfurobacterium atlanticum TaxID=240169 RepID=A0A238YGX4_9BACT|nr:phosphoesterase [Desulfurobacterium atlanticum]SNR69874.1 hypothetical protein SAMN06265340_103110 [Desulfurobacterium atlanticum]
MFPLFFVIFLLLLFFFYLDIRPIKRLKKLEKGLSYKVKIPQNIYRYNVAIHIHTQFSRDSLGKPSDIKKAMEVNAIDYAFITDHDNDNYKFFEDERTITGVEKNTPSGRLLLLGNKIPVISHPNNFEFDHYRWKGEFKEDHLYEIINIKDAIVWNKPLTIATLIKNIFFWPFTRNLLRKWNSLIPLETWSKLYTERAKKLKIIGGLDIHIKAVYQEHTHGILIPSYINGFRWLINKIYSRKPIKNKESIMKAIANGNLYLSIEGFEGDFLCTKNGKVFLPGEKVPSGSILNISAKKKKTLKMIKKDGNPIKITDKPAFTFKLEDEGFYHVEVFEYDFRLGNLYFGFKPVAITNYFEVTK